VLLKLDHSVPFVEVVGVRLKTLRNGAHTRRKLDVAKLLGEYFLRLVRFHRVTIVIYLVYRFALEILHVVWLVVLLLPVFLRSRFVKLLFLPISVRSWIPIEIVIIVILLSLVVVIVWLPIKLTWLLVILLTSLLVFFLFLCFLAAFALLLLNCWWWFLRIIIFGLGFFLKINVVEQSHEVLFDFPCQMASLLGAVF